MATVRNAGAARAWQELLSVGPALGCGRGVHDEGEAGSRLSKGGLGREAPHALERRLLGGCLC